MGADRGPSLAGDAAPERLFCATGPALWRTQARGRRAVLDDEQPARGSGGMAARVAGCFHAMPWAEDGQARPTVVPGWAGWLM